ncbi:hypothetical protein ACETU7_20920 [Rhodococcus sp. 3Y1]
MSPAVDLVQGTAESSHAGVDPARRGIKNGDLDDARVAQRNLDEKLAGISYLSSRSILVGVQQLSRFEHRRVAVGPSRPTETLHGHIVSHELQECHSM